MGRPSNAEKWLEPDNLILLEGWAADGLTDEEIAGKIGIEVRTLYRWKKKHSILREALSNAKEIADRKVERALYELALGKTVTVKKAIKLRTETNKPGVGRVIKENIQYVDEEIYIPPNVTAQIFWLKNRMPQKYREKLQTKLDEEEQRARIEALLTKVPDSMDEDEDDGFLDALNGTAAEDWTDEEA